MNPTSAGAPKTGSSKQQRCLVVISYYDQQPVDTLLGLLQSILDQPAGGAYDVCIVINETQDHRVDPVGLGFVPIVLHRPNTGMNIGAWDHGWRQNPGYGDYLFLQNECFAIAPLWLKGFRNRSEQVGAGLLGESMNEVWDSSWEQLRERQGVAVMREHLLDGEPANRVDVYLDFMKRHGISPGPTGLHLRSLVWFAGGELLAKLDGFPLGENYGECIASEIAVSRKVVSGGYALAQVGEKPFKFFRHREWKEKYPGGPFRHFRGGADGLS